MRFRVMPATLLLLAAPAAAAGQGTGPKFGCPSVEYRQFDFWVGRWDVTVQGKPAGTNEITLEEDGCLIHEHWKGGGGGTGQSFNFYDRSTRQWNQVWVSNQGAVLRLAGSYAGDQMRFTGVAPGPGGTERQQRLTFFKNADGSVRQLWEASGDGGTNWQVVFDGLYRKQP